MSTSQTKVLIVEDEAIVACDIERRLIKAGYEVPAIAASGEEALRKPGTVGRPRYARSCIGGACKK